MHTHPTTALSVYGHRPKDYVRLDTPRAQSRRVAHDGLAWRRTAGKVAVSLYEPRQGVTRQRAQHPDSRVLHVTSTLGNGCTVAGSGACTVGMRPVVTQTLRCTSCTVRGRVGIRRTLSTSRRR